MQTTHQRLITPKIIPFTESADGFNPHAGEIISDNLSCLINRLREDDIGISFKTDMGEEDVFLGCIIPYTFSFSTLLADKRFP
jgi:hypothetical protein